MWVLFDLITDVVEELLDDFLDGLDKKDINGMPGICFLLAAAAVILHAL